MKSVVVLLSDKRSGSTMFQRELCRHPAIRHVEYTPHSNFETHHWLKGAVMLDMPNAGFSGGRGYKGYGGPGNARTYMLDCVRGNVTGYAPGSAGKALVFEAWDALCQHYAKPVFFEKSPQHLANWNSLSLLLEWIATTDMTVKVIGLTRNPLAVMHSASELFHTAPWQRQHGWLEIQQNMLSLRARLPADAFKLCRYEDIIENPREAFAEVTDFIGLEPQAACGSGVKPGLAQRWRMDENYTLSLSPEVDRMARYFGYTSDELHNPRGVQNAGHSARSAQTLRLLPGRLRDRVITPLRLGWKHRD